MLSFSSEIVISRSPKQVWEIFTQCESWSVWWGGAGLKSAEWIAGGKMYWGIGGYSTILEIDPGKRIHYQTKGAFTTDTVYTFLPEQSGLSTLVIVEKEYVGVEGGASKKSEMDEELAGLKKLVEKK